MIGIENEKKKVSQAISNWGRTQKRYLNVISLPYNSCSIFLEIIIEYLYNDKEILVICNGKEDSIDIINLIKKYTNIKRYIYFRGKDTYINYPLVVTNHINAQKIENTFDLVIYDDLTSVSLFKDCQVASLLDSLTKSGGKAISYSIESIFSNEEDIILPVRDDGKPLSEPRFIKTRIDLNEDIPFVVYEYINWSLKLNRNIIMYAPDRDRAINVYNYFNNFHRDICKDINIFSEEGKDKKLLYNFLKRKRGILVTEVYDALCMNLRNVDVMVYFSDDSNFDYKKLVFISGKSGGNDGTEKGEVIFLGSNLNPEIEKAKKIIRDFNKEAWETGLLNI